ncbi:MAG TPA: hypothetical protein VK754_06140 [Propionibacteriaceae bacterium]|nr:hypothetical protein [Propionibacteriaceae bacterium]
MPAQQPTVASSTPNTPLSTQGGQKLNTWAGVAEARLAIKITWPSL